MVTDEHIRQAMRHPRSDTPATDLPAVVYHATPASNVASIEGHGLVPSTRDLIETHPPRVYLTPCPLRALLLCRLIRMAMVDAKMVPRAWQGDFAILAVRTEGLDARHDPSSIQEGGVYVDAAIAPEAIRVAEVVDGRALLTSEWRGAWRWARDGGPRPDCLRRMGVVMGRPTYDGWVAADGGPAPDPASLWDDAPSPRPRG